VGLATFIFLFPAVGVTIVRLQTDLPHPSPSAFSGYKGPLALVKTPQRIYLFSGVATQLLLTLGQLVVLQGFSTLRSVSLCVIDAFFDSIAATTVVSIILMVQISATAIVGFRAWLEQHIAKRVTAGVKRTSSPAFSIHKRSDTMATFGFDRKEPPPALDLTATRPRLPTWEANALKGEEQIGISAPFNILKDGSIRERDSRSSHFVSAEEQQHYQERGIYIPKTGGYVPANAKFGGSTPPVPSIPFAPRSADLPSRDIPRAPNFASSTTPTLHAFTFNATSTPRTAGLAMSKSDYDSFASYSPRTENRPSSDIFDNVRSSFLLTEPLSPMPHTVVSSGWTTPTESSIARRSTRASFAFPPPTPAPLAHIAKSGPKTTNVSTSDLWPPPMPDIRQKYPGGKVSNSFSSSSSSSYGGSDYVFPNQTNVSTADLWPPPNPEYERIAALQRAQLQSQISATSNETAGWAGAHKKKGSKDSAKSARQRESRPMDGNVPVRDSFMGFYNGR